MEIEMRTCSGSSIREEKQMFKVFRLMLLSVVVLAWSLPVQGQAQSSRFKYQVTPYFWFSDLDGNVGVLGRSAHANVSFGDIWDNLKFGAMGTFEGRWNEWVFLGDVIYTNLEN